jgi:D-glycero-D-manno-heptose 1,7-bisphosphate phosphatase
VGVDRLKPAVFLDRDGVLNDVVVTDGVPHPPQARADFRLLPGVPEACAQLSARGFVLVVVTNQPDVARGTQTRENVDALNGIIAETLAVERVYTCFHDNADACACRKPKPGLLLQASLDLGLDPARSYMVGDRWSDIEAGAAAGCRTFFIDRGYGKVERCLPDWVVTDLPAAARLILTKESPL